MKIKLKNAKMMEMRSLLEPILSRRDKIGYVAARNVRILSNFLTEYDQFRQGLIEKYGKPDRDEDGNELPTISIKIGSPNFKAFCDELAPFNEMEHEVELMTAKYDEAIDCLSGEELLSIDWMFED